MGKIILVTGGNRRAVENYSPRGPAYSAPTPACPFWLDFLSPSERLLSRISIPFKFHPRALRACLTRHRQPSCEDFGRYLFIQTSLLEPSEKSLFIQRDLKIFLRSEYLITIHKRGTPLRRLLSTSQVPVFTHTGTLLLTLFDNSICRLVNSFCYEQNSADQPFQKCQQPKRNPLWWRLRNFRAALLREVKLLHEIAFVGGRFFNPDDRETFGSVKAKICFLCDMINGLLSRMEPPVDVTFEQGKEKVS